MTTTTDLAREEWVNAAEKIIAPYMGEHSRQYAESLYQTFVVDDGGDWTPEAAVKEDMNYWDED